MQAAVRSFRDLDAWRVAMELMIAAYELSGRLPTAERFGITSQMRRAAISVPSNIAEGHACGKLGRYRHHLHIALGSLGELSTLLEACLRLKLLSTADTSSCERLVARSGQLLHGLVRGLQRRQLPKLAVRSALLAALALALHGLPVLG